MALGDRAVAQCDAAALQLHPACRNTRNADLIRIAGGEVQLGYLLKAQVGYVADAPKGLKFGSDTAHLSRHWPGIFRRSTQGFLMQTPQGP